MQQPNGAPGASSSTHGEPTSVDHVLATIQGALSVDGSTRGAAETSLRAWEADAAPGFLVSLLRIVEQRDAIDAVSAQTT